MHISEGVLSPQIIIPTAIVAGCFAGFLIYRLKVEAIVKVACFSAIFFIASFIHLPIGDTSIHLILSGFIGAILGIDAFLAIFVGLVLQGVFFAYGGITTLGANSLIIGFPAILAPLFLKIKNRLVAYFCAGFFPILISSFLLSLTLFLNGEDFSFVAKLAFLYNLPLCVAEGIIALFGLSFIAKINKDLLCEKS